MKGFIKIFEAIIASLILLASLSFFFSMPLADQQDYRSIRVGAEDLVFSMDKNGTLEKYIFTNNKTALADMLSKFLSKSADFSVGIKNVPNPDIYIAALSAEDRDRVNNIAGDEIIFKNRTIILHYENTSLDNIKGETNMVVYFGYRLLDKEKLNEFLGRGGTVFMIGDLDESQTKDGIMNDTFGLFWAGSGTDYAVFHDTENQENVSYRIAKYLKNISGLSESTVFDFSESGIGADSKTIVGSTRSFVKANYDIKNGNGRAVWFSGRFLSNENKWLLKAMILWASGESYSMDLYEKTVPKYYTRIKYILSGSEDYAIDMKLWTVFR